MSFLEEQRGGSWRSKWYSGKLWKFARRFAHPITKDILKALDTPVGFISHLPVGSE
jgi:hypothetical protein